MRASSLKKSTLLLLILAASVSAYKLVNTAWNFPKFEGDTHWLYMGAKAALSCVKLGQFSDCPGVIHFAFFGYVPAAISHLLHTTEDQAMRFYEFLNFLSVVAIAAWGSVYLSRKRSNAVGAMFLVAMISSPFLVYMRSTFGEPISGFLVFLFTLTCLKRESPFKIGVLFLLAGLTKEIATPFLLLLGFAAWNPDLRSPRNMIRPVLAPMLAGAVASVAITGAFNFFRFGTFQNGAILDPIFQVGSWAQSGIFFSGLLASPNAGLFVLWPAVFLFVFVLFCFRLKDGINGVTSWGLSALALFGLVGGFSLWFAPFGWIAWGPRLLLPWVPSILLINLYHYAPQALVRLKRFRTRTFGRLGVAIGCAAIAFAGVINFTATFNEGEISRFFTNNPECPRLVAVQTETEEYYRCLTHLTWPRQVFMARRMLKVGLMPENLPFLAAFMVLLLLLIGWSLREAAVTRSES